MRHKHRKHRKTETQKHKGLLRGSEQYWHLLQALALSFTLTSNPFLPTSIQQTLCCDCKYLPASDFAFVEVLSFCKRAIKPFLSLIETRAYIWYWKRVHQGIRAADLKQILMESFSWQFDWLVDPFTRLAGLTCNNGWWPNDCLISNLPDTHSKNHNDSYDTSSTSNLCLSCDENAAILLGEGGGAGLQTYWEIKCKLLQRKIAEPILPRPIQEKKGQMFSKKYLHFPHYFGDLNGMQRNSAITRSLKTSRKKRIITFGHCKIRSRAKHPLL